MLEERTRLLEKLHQAQKMESLGILLAGVAHNINNVFSVIMGTASLREQAKEPSDLRSLPDHRKASAREGCGEVPDPVRANPTRHGPGAHRTARAD